MNFHPRHPSKILRPSAGSPDNSSDPYFMQIREDLSDKGFFTATAEELIT
jgi:NADH-quinone oxidoreductase subunit B